MTHYTSIRELARELNCGESLLRGLILAIRAPVEDRLLAHWGKISTNELVRRAKVAEIKSAAKEHEATEFERTQASIRGSKTICDWLIQEKWSGGFGEQIFCEAQRKLALAERTNQFPKDAAPAAMAVVEIIRRCRPPALTTDAINPLATAACWLARWALCAFTDPGVRYQALKLALDVQFKR